MSENIITVHLLTNNQPWNNIGSNDFENVNLLETLYPVKSYSKAYICIEGLIAAIGEVLPFIQILTPGLVNTYEYTVSTGRKVCESSEILDVINSINRNSIFEYKSFNDKWREINIGNLTNFTLKIKKDSPILFDIIFLTLKIKLIE